MRLKCPSCGATGTDVKPYDHHPGAPPLPRSTVKETEEYAFEVYGNLGGRPVRKCLNCGAGIRVTFLPPRFRRLSDEEWAEFKVRFETWRAEDRARMAARRAEQDAHRSEKVEALVDRVRAHLLEVEEEAGGPQTYPGWALRQFVKSTIISEVVPTHIPALATASDDETPERFEYEKQLDRVLQDEGLSSVADEVFAAVTITPDQWDQMTDEERRELVERRTEDED